MYSSTTTAAPYPLVKGLPYEYPAAEGVVGSAINLNEETPKLFTPLKIRNMTLANRIGVSPMCQYTAHNLEVTDYHKIHYGAFATRGPGLVTVEAAAVSPYSGSSVVDLGIWTDSQAVKLKDIVDYAHANTSTIGIQLEHGGRKSMQTTMFQSLEGWDPRGFKDKVVAPSAIEYRKNGALPVPKELTRDEIKTIVKEFGLAAKRAEQISGFDFIELHAAHGFLINQFLSAHSNKRTDEYGGSFEGRIRFLVEVIEETRRNVSKDFPVFLRISASELHDSNPDAWRIEDSMKLAPIVVEKGVDVIDVSVGGNDSNADRLLKGDFGTHVELATKIKEAIGDNGLVACVGKLNDSKRVNKLLEKGSFDLALVGSQFLFNPGLTFKWAEELEVDIHHIPSQWCLRPKYKEMIEYIESTLHV